ncbi:MAG: NusG domain II-containing protein [Acholeplasmatales bacterium]|nr:NusG domain II-containing protein [Acholeplasmatales bacterium]
MNKKRNDIILISSIILVLTVVFIIWNLFNKEPGKKAIIYHNSEVIKEVDLSEDQEFTISGNISELTIIVKDGKICVFESGCENQICVDEGYKENDLDLITCIPNGIQIKVVGDE